VDKRSAAGVFHPGELFVEGAWPDAKVPGGLMDGGVLGEHEETVQAPPGVVAGERRTERFGQVTGVAAGCGAGGDADLGAAAADGDAVVAGERAEGLHGAADLGGFRGRCQVRYSSRSRAGSR
jgi:hypothetical protein